jgi:hypothetical protein
MTDERYYFGDMRIQKTAPRDWELLLDDRVQPSQIPALINHLQQFKLHTLRPRLPEDNTVLMHSAPELLRDFNSAQSQAIGLAKLNPFLAACMAFHAGTLAHRWCFGVEDAFHFPRLSTLPLHEALLSNQRLQRCFIFGYMTEERSRRSWLPFSAASEEQRRLEDAIRLLPKRPRSHARAVHKLRPSLRAYWDAIVSWRRWYPPAIQCAAVD